MLDDVVKFVVRVIAEIFGPAFFEGIYYLITWRIKGHPYITCHYRGFMVALVVYIFLTLKHYFIDQNLSIMALSDFELSAKVWGVLTLLLMLITFIVRHIEIESKVDEDRH